MDDIETDCSEWLHSSLIDRFGLESESWAVDRINRVCARLNDARSGQPRLIAEILWIQELTAFIAPGRYLYIARELLQRTSCDEPAAFVVAHEMAHHDLGHTALLRGPLAALRNIPMAFVLGAVTRLSEKMIFGPEMEEAADIYAAKLCMKAGYDAHRCLELFDILEAYSLDHGDIAGVYGAHVWLEQYGQRKSHVSNLLKWTGERMRGYRSLNERRKVVEQLLCR